jgi:hypothetical protein
MQRSEAGGLSTTLADQRTFRRWPPIQKTKISSGGRDNGSSYADDLSNLGLLEGFQLGWADAVLAKQGRSGIRILDSVNNCRDDRRTLPKRQAQEKECQKIPNTKPLSPKADKFVGGWFAREWHSCHK